MKKVTKITALLLSIMMLMAISAAADMRPSVYDLATGVTLSDSVSGIEETGKNLTGFAATASYASAIINDVAITVATVQDDAIHIAGTAKGTPFDVSGSFCSISENGNVIAFDSTDSTHNFRVVYCAIEKDLEKSSLYFRPFASENLENYTVVTKLYLAPNTTDTAGEYIIAELYGTAFPEISSDAIRTLPENHLLNLFWYAKEFSPTSTAEEPTVTRAGNPPYILLESYTYENLGMTYRHYLRYEEQCDIRDVGCNEPSIASATLVVTQKWVDAELENDRSNSTSALSLRNISVGYLTAPRTAVNKMISSGEVTKSGALKLDFSLRVGAGIKGLDIPVPVSLTYTPSDNHYASEAEIKIATNSGDNYWRDAIACIDSSYYLDAIGNNICTSWTYSSYSGIPETLTAKLVFQFGVYNLLDYTQYRSVEHFRAISINVKP